MTVLHHLVAEATFIVEHIVGDTDPLGRRARVVDVLTGAAGALLLDRRAVVVELQRNADDVIAGPRQQGGGDRGVHATRHGGHNPCPDG